MIQDENINEVSKLVELSGSNYEIVDGEPDIKGWDVITNQHQKIGEVDDMLFDIKSQSVKYIIVELDNSVDSNNKKILIPIESAALHSSEKLAKNASNFGKDTEVDDDSNETFNEERTSEQYNNFDDNDVVIVPVEIEMLKNMPAYNKDMVTAENEATIGGMFGSTGHVSPASTYSNEKSDEGVEANDYQNNPTQKLNVIEENLQVNKQTITTGGTKLVSRLVEKPVEKTIELKDEHITVVRTPIDRPVSSVDADPFKEEQIEMTEYSEVPVVKKEARVVEEISVSKDISEKEEIIKETLRNTEVTTEDIKNTISKDKNL